MITDGDRDIARRIQNAAQPELDTSYGAKILSHYREEVVAAGIKANPFCAQCDEKDCELSLDETCAWTRRAKAGRAT